jgi:hypothetical protein
MTIDKTRIKRMIKEEIEKLFLEANPAHKGKGPGGGRFAKKGQGKVYSLTKNALDDVNPEGELEVPARGRITSQGKISSKFGMNGGDPDKNCGRLTIDGNSKKKTRRCDDYPAKYEEKKSTPGREKQKKETEKRNRFKNKADLVPRSVDSPSVKRDKLFGDQELMSLARGIAEEEAKKGSVPYWDKSGRLQLPDDELADQEQALPNELDETSKLLQPADEVYIKELIKQNVAAALQQTRQQAQKQGVGCSWRQLMGAIQDIETAQKGHKEPK